MRPDRAAIAALVALALFPGCSRKRTPLPEEQRRDAFVKEIVAREGTQAAYGVSSRPDLRFDWGFSVIEYDAAATARARGLSVDKPDEHPKVAIRSRAFRWV